MTRKPEPKREKGEWMPHEAHCKCGLIALPEMLNALSAAAAALETAILAHDVGGCEGESCQVPYDLQKMGLGMARSALAKYSKQHRGSVAAGGISPKTKGAFGANSSEVVKAPTGTRPGSAKDAQTCDVRDAALVATEQVSPTQRGRKGGFQVSLGQRAAAPTLEVPPETQDGQTTKAAAPTFADDRCRNCGAPESYHTDDFECANYVEPIDEYDAGMEDALLRGEL